jgi:predicted NAD/FAD-binding protein
MRVAVIGSGIAGNVVAARLHREHDVTVFEAGSHVGGHAHTHDIVAAGRSHAVDTGFIVYNDLTYPHFSGLLDTLGVSSQPTRMSFSVRCERTGLEYNGTSLNGLFAQRRNLLRPSFLRMIRDILRFNREAPALLAAPDDALTLGDYLEREGYGRELREHYLLPMGAAIWSTEPRRMLDFPAAYFVRFFHNHGMLTVNGRPQWRVVRGGSREYVRRLTAPFASRIRLSTPVRGLRRHANDVEIQLDDGRCLRFDTVFLACHSDQALRLLQDPSPAEREVLGAIRYQRNEVVLHTDTRLLPRSPRARAAWNYHLPAGPGTGVAVTYDMNLLQGIASPLTFCVTLNRSEAIAPSRVLMRLDYDHPVYTRDAVAAQARHAEIDGARRTYYCGAYWGFGFHEDGVRSALAALDHFHERRRHAQLPVRRVG